MKAKKILVYVLSLLLVFNVLMVENVYAANETASLVIIEDVSGYAGDQVTVKVKLSNNPGIAGMDFKVNYDTKALKVVSTKAGTVFSGPTVNEKGKNFVGFSYASSSNTKNLGTILEITFEILNTAEAGKTYTLTLTDKVVCDENADDVKTEYSIGGVKVLSAMLGDVNDDKVVDVTDAVLVKQYIAKISGVKVSLESGDVNRDGVIDVTDAVMIMQKIAGIIKEFEGGSSTPTPAPTQCSHTYSIATCTKPATCSKCGATTGSTAAHNYSTATCTQASKCTVCGVTGSAALGHNYVSGKCTRCGDVNTSSLYASNAAKLVSYIKANGKYKTDSDGTSYYLDGDLAASNSSASSFYYVNYYPASNKIEFSMITNLSGALSKVEIDYNVSTCSASRLDYSWFPLSDDSSVFVMMHANFSMSSLRANSTYSYIVDRDSGVLSAVAKSDVEGLANGYKEIMLNSVNSYVKKATGSGLSGLGFTSF